MSRLLARLGHVLADLRRRRVFRAAAIYAVAAYGAMEVANNFLPPLGFPAWTLTFVAVICVLGFVPVVVLSYFFDFTTEGVQRSSPAASPDHAAPVLMPRHFAGMALALAVLIAAAWAGYTRFVAPSPITDRSLAVLPFSNLSGREENEYLSDGITEDILTSIAKIGEIRVISRTSVMPYKKTDKGLRQIAEELGVAYILEGSVQRDGDRIRITAQLIDAATDAHIWAEHYDRDLAGVLSLQTEISGHIARALGTHLSRDERRRVAAVPTGSEQAYDLHLRARDHSRRHRKEDNHLAIDFLKQAIALDPGFAAAYATLSLAYTAKVNRHGEDPAWVDSAMVAAQRAIALDPELSAGYNALGTAHLIAGRGRDALPALERALELDPSSASPIMSLAILHGMAGRHDQAARWLRRALTIEPARSSTVLHNLAVVYRDLGMLAPAREANERSLMLQPDDPFANSMRVSLAVRSGDLEKAIVLADGLTAANPGDATAWVFAGEVHLQAGDCGRARGHFERAYRSSPLAEGTVAYVSVLLGNCLWQTGDRDRAISLFDAMALHAEEEIATGNHHPALFYSLAASHAVRGQHADATRHLAQAIDEGFRDAWLLEHDPLLEPLRADRTFQQMAAALRATVAEMRARAERESSQ